MTHFNELLSMLNQHFHWNKARIDCFVGMLIALFKLRSVNLTEIAAGFPNQTQLASRHLRVEKDAKVPNSRGDQVQVHCLFRFLKVGESLVIRDAWLMTGIEVYLSVLRLDDG